MRARGKKPYPRRLLLSAVAPLILSSIAAALAADQDEPIVISAQKPYQRVYFERPKITLGLEARYAESESSSGSTKAKGTDTLFRETLGASTSGYIVTPNILSLDLSGEFGLTQERTGGDVTDSGDGQLYTFDLRGQIFRNGVLPLTLYARRSDDLSYQPFVGSIQTTTTTYGADLAIRWAPLASTIRAYHTDQQQSIIANTVEGSGDYKLKQDTIEFHADRALGKQSALTLDYTYNHVREEAFQEAPQEFDTHDGTAMHLYSWDDGQSTLRSSLNYFKQTGQFPSERYRLDENLRVYYSDHFETFANYQFQNSTLSDTTQVQHRAEAGLRHRLFNSLTTTATIGAAYLDFNGDSTTLEESGSLSVDYTKKIAYGQLTINGGISLGLQQNTARVEPTFVLDQPFTFTGALPVVIQRQDVNPASLHVTDPRNIRTYRLGLDYTVVKFPDRVEIRRVFTGDIPFNGPILVDYQLAPEPGFDMRTTTYNAGARYDIREGWLNGLAPYIRYLSVEQTIDAKQQLGFVADNIHELTFGADYRVWKLRFKGEHRIHDSTLAPYRETRFEAEYQDRFGQDTSVSFQATYDKTSYTDGEDVSSFLASATADHTISRELFLTGIVNYIQQEDSVAGPTHGYDAQLRVRWKHRQTEVYGGFRYADLVTEDGDQRSIIFQVGIRRDF